MTLPFLDTNAGEMAAKVGALRCDLGAMRAALAHAERQAREGFSGPEADAFVSRCAAVHRAVAELDASLTGLPVRILTAGDQIEHARRDAIAAALGPGAEAINGVANVLGW
jgi:hypothetical protein